MAKDDYNVIVYKVLLYLYAIFKRKIPFDETEFKKSILKSGISEDYLIEVLKLMQDEELIKGLKFISAWGCELLLINEIRNAKITAKGIEYLTENSRMQKVKEFLIENVDIFASLIKLVITV